MEIGPAPLALKRKVHLHAVRRLYLAVVNRAILDVLENDKNPRSKAMAVEQRLDSLQARSTTSELFSHRRHRFAESSSGCAQD